MRNLIAAVLGLAGVTLTPVTLGDVAVEYMVTGPGGNEAQYPVVMSGVLGDIEITCTFELDGGYTWPGDLILAVVDPEGNGVEFGGYNMTLGYPSAGDFPGSWDVGEAGVYTHSFSLAGYGLQGGGEWSVIFANGYTGGLETDIFSGVLTALGMYSGTEPFGGCCTDVGACFVGTQDECAASGGSWLGENTNCDNWPCGGAPEGACCLGTNCSDTDIVTCTGQGGEFQGEGTTCDSGICEIYGACCLGTECTDMSLDHCVAAGGTFQGEDLECVDVVCPWDEPTLPMVSRMVGHGLLAGNADSWTVDLFVILPEGGHVEAVAGTAGQPLTLTATADFYQSPVGGPTASSVNPALYDTWPDLEWDSRVMIGALDDEGGTFDGNDLQDVGIDWALFEDGGTAMTSNGAWFVLPDAPQGEPRPLVTHECETVEAVCIARLTLLEADAVISFDGVVQGRDGQGEFFHERARLEAFATPHEDCNANGVSDVCDIANGTSADDNGDGVPDDCSECDGDVDGDGGVGITDLLVVIAMWGSDGGNTGADLDGDGIVAIEDLLIVLSFYGVC